MRVVAIDYGRARTGVAVSDETGTLARPVGVVERVRSPRGRRTLLEQIATLEPERVVVGLPVTLRGRTGRQAGETMEFIRELEAECPVPIESYDERFTTALATRSGSRRSPRAVDAVAAAHLLDGYLRRLAG